VNTSSEYSDSLTLLDCPSPPSPLIGSLNLNVFEIQESPKTSKQATAFHKRFDLSALGSFCMGGVLVLFGASVMALIFHFPLSDVVMSSIGALVRKEVVHDDEDDEDDHHDGDGDDDDDGGGDDGGGDGDDDNDDDGVGGGDDDDGYVDDNGDDDDDGGDDDGCGDDDDVDGDKCLISMMAMTVLIC